MRFGRNLGLFTLGGSAYVGLELLYRGRSHISMFGAGGACFLALGQLRRLPAAYPVKMLTGAGVITAVELATGLLVNRDYHVWDYRGVPGNYKGQICPLFSVIWLPVAAVGMGLYGAAERMLQR